MSLTLAISLLGWLALLSATHIGTPLQAGKQAIFLIIGFLLAWSISWYDYRKLYRWAYAPYFISLLLLLAIFAVGVTRNGSRRWLDLGFMLLQPSEVAKLALVIALSRVLAAACHSWEQPKRPYLLSIKALCVAGLPTVLIAAQPDLGTSLVLVAIVYLLLYCFGGSLVLLFGSVASVLGGAPWYLQDYQMQRISTFLDPDSDPLGVGYNLAQAKAAIGSGGTWGLGLFHGPLTQSHFVPENETDFIFTVIGEELGLIGTMGLITLFFALLIAILNTAALCRDRFGACICMGVACILTFQIVVNIAMTLGLAPVVGLPLPLCSYGGSTTLTTMISIGLIASVARARGRSETSYQHASGLQGKK